MSNEAPTFPIRKYCGILDSRTPPQFLREFTQSTLFTCNDLDDGEADISCIRNFLASLGDRFHIYIPAFYGLKSFREVEKYFLKLTWTDEDKQEELETIKAEKFDVKGQVSWEKYLIQTYIRLMDCEANDKEFQKVMLHKLYEVGKSDLPVNNFIREREEKKLYPHSKRNEDVQRVASHDLSWFAQIVYVQSARELKNVLKLLKADVDH